MLSTPSPRSLLAPAAAGAFIALAPEASAAITIDGGHADYGPRIVGGDLVSQVKDASGGRWFDPADVIVRLGSDAHVRLPRGVSFIGRPGARAWLIPQVQRSGVPWLGWNTERITGREVRDRVAWTLTRPYSLTFRMRARSRSGRPIGDTATLRFEVG